MNNPNRRGSRSQQSEAWQRWYKLARWQKLRWAVLIRDKFTCQRTGEVLIGKHPDPNSPVANHIEPHKGKPELFWDMDNIETVSKRVHDSDIQSEEKTGRKRVEIGADGWPIAS